MVCLRAVVLSIAISSTGCFSVPLFDGWRNGVTSGGQRPIPDAARQFHAQLFVADLHADTLLWRRDLLRRHDRGHVDVPRLLEGNVGMQVFTVVTKYPLSIREGRFHQRSFNLVGLLTFATRWWDPSSWFSLRQRADRQRDDLLRAARTSPRIRFVRSRKELSRARMDREDGEDVVAALLGLEGLHWLPTSEKKARTEVLRLFDSGFRMISPTHHFDNNFAGSSTGIQRPGLSRAGKAAVREMFQLNIVVDLAHASDETMKDVLAVARAVGGSVVVSHTGVRATCEHRRNLSDDSVKAIVEAGGLIGVGLWREAVCGHSVMSTVKAMCHIKKITDCSSCIALGSDFDGSVTTAVDASALDYVTAELRSEHVRDYTSCEPFSDDEIRGIMGENAYDYFMKHLP